MAKTIQRTYRPKEVSELYGVALSTVWYFAKQGKITPKKISKNITLFDAKEVESFFNPKIDEVKAKNANKSRAITND